MHFEQQGMAFDFTLKQLSESIESPELTSEDLDQYVGTYVSDELPMDLTISREENTLIAQGTGQASFPLTTEGDHIFSKKEYGLKITFIPSEKKMHFEQGGTEFTMTLEK